MKMWVILIASLVLINFSDGAVAASLIEGTVVNAQSGEPVAGVKIGLNASGRDVDISQATTSDGRFSINPEDHFSAREIDTWAIALTFTAEDYVERTQVKRAAMRGEFIFANLKVDLAPAHGVWSLPEELKRQLRAIKSDNGKALFIVPYVISEDAKARLPADFMRILSFNIHRGIFTHLQELELEDITEDISIQALPLNIPQSSTEKLRVVGKELNALALVGGLGAAGPDIGSDPVTELSSKYVIIPKLDGFNPGSIYIDDRLVGQPLNTTTLYEGLDALWGRNTLLAISALETKHGILKKDKRRLDTARSYLLAERKMIGQNNTLLLRKINKLISFIDENAAKLEGGTQ